MTISQSLHRQVLESLRIYQSQHPEQNDLDAFAEWLESQESLQQDGQMAKPDHGDTQERYLAFMVMFLYRQFRMYARKALQDSDLANPDSYSFLLHLREGGPMRKMDLINLHYLEGPTGVEILKRLQRKGYVDDRTDPDDRRARLVQITPSGQAILEQLEPKMERVFAIMASLPPDQISGQVLPGLERLFQHHAAHYGTLRKLGLIEAESLIQRDN
ncbi:MAG: MarR family transcriptional regulator [Bacteroidetes bacterium]|nr:MAG: MarR family transcriptional regulator [Bacteroidota bacterium]